ncbi:MAG: IPTL-CTERM sorting domain-containing protein, partial [Saprospiraceae bacterium]|nr:IPTL-CTERM sorting domain-containing protein [Saprospiraceae bacterium]
GVSPIPTLGEWGIMILMLVMLIVGIITVRQKNIEPTFISIES